MEIEIFIHLALSNVINNNLNYLNLRNKLGNFNALALVESIIRKMSRYEYINVLRINILGTSSS